MAVRREPDTDCAGTGPVGAWLAEVRVRDWASERDGLAPSQPIRTNDNRQTRDVRGDISDSTCGRMDMTLR
ncbi:MAG: hypothetical protein EBV77_07420 [Gemmatimonadaceae bacterium]|nr:hypothetical protein [Gemmatimonadaceae bacterium]